MKTNIAIITVALMLGVLLSPLRAQSDKIISRTDELSDFSVIRMEAVGDIFFTQSEDCSLRIEGKEKEIEKITVTVTNGKLFIRYKKEEKDNKLKGLKFYLTSPDLSYVDIRGVGDFRCEEKLQLKDLMLKMEGVGSIDIADLKCKTLHVSAEGVGKVNIHVDCDRLVGNVDGVGHITLSGNAKSASISKDGIGGVNTRNLKVGK